MVNIAQCLGKRMRIAQQISAVEVGVVLAVPGQSQLQQTQQGGGVGTGSGIPGVKLPDFSQFGEVEKESMSRMMAATATNMQRSWLNVPHVTQFDDADITEMEDFRKAQKAAGEKRGVKMTPLPFLLKACATALRAHQPFPSFS